MRRVLASFLALCGFLAGAHGVRADSIAGQLPVGTTYENQVQVGSLTVPLPPGQWTVSSFNETRSNHNNKIAQITFSSIQNGKYLGFVNIRSSIDPAQNGWDPHKFCSRKNVYYMQVDANYKYEEACWGINHVLMNETSDYQPAEGRNTRQVVADAGLTMPRTMISTLIRLANRAHFITYEVTLNPTFYGFPDETAGWANNPWHKDLIARDPRKSNFIEQLKARHMAIYTTLKPSFR